MDNSNQFLGTAPVGRLMRRYAVPCVISLLVGALYNIVDQIFIANASYLGSCGNAANTVVFPLTVVALAIAVMIGDGCCAFVSISLGCGRREDAHRAVGNAVALCLGSSLVLTALYLIFRDPILALFGGTVNPETYAFAKEYFLYITLGIPFYMFGQAMNPIIRSDGSPRFAMAATVSGAAANLILDPLFLFVFRWGMMGAAVATVIGQVLTAGLSLWRLLRMRNVTLAKASFRLRFPVIRRFLALGLTSLLSQVSLVLSMAAVQNMCMKYGARDPIFGQTEYAQIPLAVLGIVMKFFQVAISVAIGTAAGCIPIAGYNIGAGRNDRAKALFTRLLWAELAVGAIALIIAEGFPLSIARLFGAAGESVYYAEFTVKCFRTYLCLLPLATLNKGCFIYLQALGKATASTAVSLTREILFGVFLPILLPRLWGLDGLLWSFPAADLLTFFLTLVFLRQTYRQLSDGTLQPE